MLGVTGAPGIIDQSCIQEPILSLSICHLQITFLNKLCISLITGWADDLSANQEDGGANQLPEMYNMEIINKISHRYLTPWCVQRKVGGL